MIWRFAALILLLAGPVQASECREAEYADTPYALCEVDLTQTELRLFLRNKNGGIHGYFSSVNSDLAAEGKKLGFAMNAGMYHEDRAPVGLYLENGTQAQRLITADGPGNFGLLPNGVFCIEKGRAAVIESRAFARQPRECTFASQSGPMLVIDGALHPRFLIDSTSRFIRNGVGVSADGRKATFVISRKPVTFHAFGTVFKDSLKIPNALYFDGNISRIYAPQIGTSGLGWQSLGPIVGTVVPAE
ncbi:phosphodiester glycosidase family protein [Planktotalea arctica]|uniref:phosphodiester glycosidase family protein n=1 Tax=Planktotalea arctica TaxID=1481893 RepID=UPI00321B8617